MLGTNFINTLTEEKTDEYLFGHINRDFLEKNVSDFSKPVYLCGPPDMMTAIEGYLSELNLDMKLLVKEEDS